MFKLMVCPSSIPSIVPLTSTSLAMWLLTTEGITNDTMRGALVSRVMAVVNDSDRLPAISVTVALTNISSLSRALDKSRVPVKVSLVTTAVCIKPAAITVTSWPSSTPRVLPLNITSRAIVAFTISAMLSAVICGARVSMVTNIGSLGELTLPSGSICLTCTLLVWSANTKPNSPRSPVTQVAPSLVVYCQVLPSSRLVIFNLALAVIPSLAL